MLSSYRLIAGLFVVAVLGCSSHSSAVATSQAGGSAAPGKGVKVSWSGTHPITIVDPQYSMTAATMNVPTGWKYAASVVRPGGCHAGPYPSLAWTVVSPDGVTAIAGLPAVAWSWSSDPAFQKRMEKICAGVDVHSATGFLVNIAVPNMHPGAKIVGVVPADPGDAAMLAKQQAQARAIFPAGQAIIEAARVRVQYSRGGQMVEELISAAINCQTVPAIHQMNCSTQGTLVERTALGHLDALLAEPEVKTLLGSLHAQNDWVMRYSRDKQASFNSATTGFNKSAAAINAQGQAAEDQLVKNAQAQRQQMETSTQHAMAADRARQNAIDGAAHNEVNYALDRKDFTNPATGQTINASSEYNHQWMSSDGSTLIQTNDHQFDPNGAVYPVSQSWTELVPQ